MIIQSLPKIFQILYMTLIKIKCEFSTFHNIKLLIFFSDNLLIFYDKIFQTLKEKNHWISFFEKIIY